MSRPETAEYSAQSAEPKRPSREGRTLSHRCFSIAQFNKGEASQAKRISRRKGRLTEALREIQNSVCPAAEPGSWERHKARGQTNSENYPTVGGPRAGGVTKAAHGATTSVASGRNTGRSNVSSTGGGVRSAIG